MPTVGGVALQRVSLANFRKTVALLVTRMTSIYTGLVAVIAFGVVYNNARISLSERARELASLRVLGFTGGEVPRIQLLELAILALVAQSPGWLMGYWLAWVMKDEPRRRTDARPPRRRALDLRSRRIRRGAGSHRLRGRHPPTH
ncbi:ABC transporter permease [Bradyrhizobium liaoningense]|uniref:ABC transporter permease n=1 Tax=Bradyrhizobium liaoningense TaxID=43992 RepID=UPI0032DFB739